MRRIGCCAALALALLGCGRDSDPFLGKVSPTGFRVLLVGIDGATFDVITPLVAAGRLPTLSGLMARGAHAPLLSLEHTWSPAVWTTVATGFLPETHGIRFFQSEGDPDHPRLVASTDRRTLAIWNIASRFGRSTGVVGWWVTWPAEPVHGFMVSDRTAYTRYQAWTEGKRTERLTHPPELEGELLPLVVNPLAAPMDEIGALAALSNEERAEMLAVERPILYHGLSVLKWGFCEQRSYEKIALQLLAKQQPDLSMLFLIAVDPISHTFWHFYQPERFDGVDPEAAARLGGVIPAIYEHDDRYLAELLAAVDPGTVVFVVSDHGFGPSGDVPKPTTTVTRTFGQEESVGRPVTVGQSGSHRLYGVLVAAGGPIVPGARPRVPPTVADVTPTILALLGLPVGRDMAGRVLDELFDPAFLEAHPVQYVDSYEGLIERAPTEAPAEAGESGREEYLRALGYIE
jgi:predicted AlkP superfamily phosphohydrolase/phosphomutase